MRDPVFLNEYEEMNMMNEISELGFRFPVQKGIAVMSIRGVKS